MTIENWIGLATFVTAIATTFLALRKGKRDKGQDDEVRIDKLKRNERLLLNYVGRLRSACAEAGIPVPDWPKELTER